MGHYTLQALMNDKISFNSKKCALRNAFSFLCIHSWANGPKVSKSENIPLSDPLYIVEKNSTQRHIALVDKNEFHQIMIVTCSKYEAVSV